MSVEHSLALIVVAALIPTFAATALAVPEGAVVAPADNVTVEVLESNSDFVNHLHVWGPHMDLEVTDDETGQIRSLTTRAGKEIKFEIRSTLGGVEQGIWRSGPAERNPDGAVHAIVTSSPDESCLLVEFEDTDASVWADDPDEPNYVDAVLRIYPDSPDFDISQCPEPAGI
jgi:hypothetical protein